MTGESGHQREPRVRCLVVGGSGEVGGAICELLGRRGCEVAFTYFQNTQRAERLAEMTGAIPLELDLRDESAVEEILRGAAAELGGLDGLVFSALPRLPDGLPRFDHRYPRMEEVAPETFELVQRVVVGGAWRCLKAASSLLSDGGSVVLLASLDAVKPAPVAVHHAAAGGALRAMVRAAAKEFGQRRIVVNLVASGLLQGGAQREVPRFVREEYVKLSAMGRLGETAEAAEMAVWLVLENTYVNGECLSIDGGI